jgi:hypothetical protein
MYGATRLRAALRDSLRDLFGGTSDGVEELRGDLAPVSDDLAHTREALDRAAQELSRVREVEPLRPAAERRGSRARRLPGRRSL